MYALDGEILEGIEDIEDDMSLVLVSQDKSHFIGLQSKLDGLRDRELRQEHAKDIRDKMENQNLEWANQKYLEWIERIIDKCGIDNMQLALSKHANNDYKLSNEDYRQRLA